MTETFRTTRPAADGFFMPPEWAPHDGSWMAWPCRKDGHGGLLAEARAAYANVARAIAEFEKITMVVNPPDEKEAAQALGDAVTVLPITIDDAWMRDSGPTFLVNDKGEVAGVDWLFNAWGYKYDPWHNDDAVAAAILRHLQLPRYLSPLVMEGGSFHSDGDGTLLTTSQCLLHTNRNPRLSQADIEQLLCAYLGVQKIVWLAGDEHDDETDGHVDNVACFAAPGRVLIMADDDDKSLRENHHLLRQADDARGRAFDIVALPRPQVGEKGVNFLASYINFYFTNGGIVMPSFGVGEDARARAMLAEQFPDRRVVQVPSLDIVRGGGGIHCITQQQPRG